MHKRILITIWLLVPVLLLAYHYGPGQKGVARDQVAAKIQAAKLAEQNEDRKAAMAAYADAIALLPPEQSSVRYQLRLAQAKARMFTGELPESMVDLQGLLSDMLKEKADAKQIREVRANLASAQYYAAWLMRLEGATPDEWTIQTENARQNFRLLAEETEQARDKAATLDYQKNLEATVRLARMDLSELEGLPLPKQCQGCKNCSQKCRKQRQSQKRSEEPKEPKDARGAGTGKRPDGTGS